MLVVDGTTRRFVNTDLLRVKQAAQLFGCSATTIRRACAEGRLNYFRLRERGPLIIPASEFEKLITPELARVADVATAATSEQVPA